MGKESGPGLIGSGVCLVPALVKRPKSQQKKKSRGLEAAEAPAGTKR